MIFPSGLEQCKDAGERPTLAPKQVFDKRRVLGRQRVRRAWNGAIHQAVVTGRELRIAASAATAASAMAVPGPKTMLTPASRRNW
jgi:hypothetical protein